MDQDTAQHSSQVRLDQQPAAQEKPCVSATARVLGGIGRVIALQHPALKVARSPALEPELLHASGAAGKAIAGRLEV